MHFTGTEVTDEIFICMQCVIPRPVPSDKSHARLFRMDDENDVSVGMDVGFKDIMAVTTPVNQEIGAKDLNGKQIQALNFSSARYGHPQTNQRMQ